MKFLENEMLKLFFLKEYMGLKEVIFDRLEVLNKNEVKYGWFILNFIGILFYK